MRVLFPLFLFHLWSLPMCFPATPCRQGQLRLSYSLRFTRRILAHVQDLLPQYKEQQLGDPQFEDRSLKMESLPSIAIDSLQWLRMEDWERLSSAAKDLHTFWVHLDRKRRQIEAETMSHPPKKRKSQTGQQKPSLTQAMFGIQRDLKDLMRQVNSQLRCLNSSALPYPASSSASSVAPPSTTPTLAWQLWASRQEGYVILRDLDRYLGKLARDFILLTQSRRRGKAFSSQI
ncbi:uncharacterized protein LOC118774570 [Megalops cyprinoides]|uniref:uncharacterized protein LOC118774570 n=1 Tax=Megalops cyprinoides TaxID=118141 RepID=UPI001864BAE6|nr:uncharacterized protein LOC118774570 [Megalops cyprinoides]